MSTLTDYDADVRPRHLYEVRLELAGKTIEIRVRAADRFEAIELAQRERRGWQFRTVFRFIAGRMVPA